MIIWGRLTRRTTGMRVVNGRTVRDIESNAPKPTSHNSFKDLFRRPAVSKPRYNRPLATPIVAQHLRRSSVSCNLSFGGKAHNTIEMSHLDILSASNQRCCRGLQSPAGRLPCRQSFIIFRSITYVPVVASGFCKKLEIASPIVTKPCTSIHNVRSIHSALMQLVAITTPKMGRENRILHLSVRSRL